MTPIVFGLVWLLWPVFAFAGGLALAPLNALAGILLAPGAIKARALKFPPYTYVVAAFLIFAAVSTKSFHVQVLSSGTGTPAAWNTFVLAMMT